MSRTLEVVVKIAAGIGGGGFLLLLIAATVRGCRRETKRWKEELMGTKSRRLSVTLGQPLEVEYRRLPESKESAGDVEISRVFAYSGAVRVEVTPLLRDRAPVLLGDLTNRCREAEGFAVIPF